MEIYDFNKEGTGQINLIIESDFSKEIRISLAKGEEMKKHKTAYPIIIHLLEGEIDFGVNGERQLLKPGNIISLEGGVPHDLIALKDSVVRLTISKLDSMNRIERIQIISR